MEFRNEEESVRKLKIELKSIITHFDILMNMPEVISDDIDDITTCFNMLDDMKIRFEESYFKYLELKENDKSDEFASFSKELNSKYCFYLKSKMKENSLSKSPSETSIESKLSNVSLKSTKSLNSVIKSTKLHQDKMKMSSSETSSLSSDSTQSKEIVRRAKKSRSSVLSSSSTSRLSYHLDDLRRTKLDQMSLPSFNLVKSAKCKVCLGSHEVYTCDSYLSKTARERYAIVSKLRLCRNCLRPGHKAINCRNEKRCKECNRKHHTTLHFTKPTEQNEKVCSKNDYCKSYSLLTVSNQEYKVQELSTIRILIPDAKGNWQSVEAIIDTDLNKKLLNPKVANNQVKVVSEPKLKNESVNQQHADYKQSRISSNLKISKLTNVQDNHKRRKESNDHQGSLTVINARQEQKSSNISQLNHKDTKQIDSCDTSSSSEWQIVRSSREKRSEKQIERSSSANSSSDHNSILAESKRLSQSRVQDPIVQNRIVQRCWLSVRH